MWTRDDGPWRVAVASVKITDVNDDMSPPRGASVWERELFDHLVGHAQREIEILEKYVAAAADTGSEALAYMIALLVEDERRHHNQMKALALSLKGEAEFSTENPAVPRLDLKTSETEKVRKLTRTLIENEKKDAAALKNLRRQLDDVADTTLWALIVDTMRIDTEKHLAILKFIDKHSK